MKTDPLRAPPRGDNPGPLPLHPQDGRNAGLSALYTKLSN